MRDLLVCAQALLGCSIFFVWVVRYDNIVQEFRQYHLPDWLRDLVGILKLTFSALVFAGLAAPRFAVIGSCGIAFLMLCAVATHFRVKNPFVKMLPSLSLLLLALAIAYGCSRLG